MISGNFQMYYPSTVPLSIVPSFIISYIINVFTEGSQQYMAFIVHDVYSPFSICKCLAKHTNMFTWFQNVPFVN